MSFSFSADIESGDSRPLLTPATASDPAVTCAAHGGPETQQRHVRRDALMRTVVASAPPAPAAVWRPPPLFRRRSAASARSPQRQLASCWAIARTARLVALAVCLLLVLLSPTGAAQPAAAGNSSSSAAVNSSSGGTSAGGAPGGGLGKLLTSAFQEQHPRPPPDGYVCALWARWAACK